MRRIIIFLIITFTITWAMAFTLMAYGGNSNPWARYVFIGFMLVPASAVILTRLITKEGFKDFGLKPNFSGNIKIYLAAWFGPTILTILGALVYFLIYPTQFDPSMQAMVDLFKQQAIEDSSLSLLSDAKIKQILLSQLLAGIFLAPLLNLIPTLGEELGWRGYLLPKLTQAYSIAPAILVSGTIWGIWHAPMIAMGHNYGLNYAGFPWGGILAMIVFCIVVGSFFAYLTYKSQSALPAALAHGALNGTAALSIYWFSGTPNPFLGPLPVGIIGGIGFILVGIICYFKSQALT